MAGLRWDAGFWADFRGKFGGHRERRPGSTANDSM